MGDSSGDEAGDSVSTRTGMTPVLGVEVDVLNGAIIGYATMFPFLHDPNS